MSTDQTGPNGGTVVTLPGGATIETFELPPLPPERSYSLGDLVTVNAEHYAKGVIFGVYRVVKTPVGPRGYNYTLESVHGRNGHVKAAPYSMTPYSGTLEDALKEFGTVAPLPTMGSVVTVSVPLRGEASGQPFVVMGHGGKEDTAKLVRLGGDGNRFFPSIPNKYLTVLSPVQVMDAVAEHGA